MESFDKRNLQNIKDIFEEKTGVDLPAARRYHHPARMAIIVAAAIVCCLSMTAFAINLFSSLSGDELKLSAIYEGNGVISIHVENQSDKELNFQHQLKLMRWSTSEEIAPISDHILFSGTEFDANTSGTMTIDISEAYDMEMLEQPLVDDHYYFVLTNNSFVFGQDWMCTVTFAQPIITEQAEPVPISPAEADPALVGKIPEKLRPYFETYVLDPAQRRAQTEEYVIFLQSLLDELGISPVKPVSPMELIQAHIDESVMFDPTVPEDMQQQLTSLHRYCTDGYGKLIGMSQEDCAMVFGAYIPHGQGEIDGGAELPLIYNFIYEKSSIRDPQDFAFIRGQLLTFEQMEQYKIYEDDRYVCYDMTDLFYTDLRVYVESMVSQRSDVHFDEQVWSRVQNIYQYYRENLGALLGYRNAENTDEWTPPLQTATIEMRLDSPENLVATQNLDVGGPSWQD